MKPHTIVFALVLCTTQARSADHLEPAAETVAGYESGVIEVLKDAFTDDVQVRAIVEPSFEKEFAVGTKESDGVFRIYFVRASQQVWSNLLNKEPTKNIGSEICEMEIPADLGRRIDLVWDGMLRQTRPNESPTYGLDGDNYYFSKDVDGKLAIGEMWSPPDDSKPGKLVDIVYTMRDLCTKKDEALATKLNEQVDDLLARLALPPSDLSGVKR
ncbi:MAG: hypothetical protein ABSA49_17150 [Rhizomicrobium sp.]|jgi:hypothetical protein